MTDTIITALILIPCLIVAIVFHEVAHGWTALMLGDPTAKERNRLSLNPIRHVDPVGTLLVPGALALFGGPIFGWAKPVPVVQNRLRNPRYGMMLVAAAGPGTNILLALIGAVAFGLAIPLFDGASTQVLYIAGEAFQSFILINIFLALFNLLPIPPFDGSHILKGLLPASMAAQYAKLQQMGMLFLIVLIAVSWAFPQANIIGRTIGIPVGVLFEQCRWLARWVAGV